MGLERMALARRPRHHAAGCVRVLEWTIEALEKVRVRAYQTGRGDILDILRPQMEVAEAMLASARRAFVFEERRLAEAPRKKRKRQTT